MNQVEALAKIQTLGQPLLETRDIAALLKQKDAATVLTATRLAKAGFLIKLGRGKWALGRGVNRLAIPEHLTAPHPTYISLQSALFYHGMISQIPSVIYAVSLAQTRRYKTPLGVISIHHAAPDFFYGYELDPTGTAKIATPEKALVDIFYFAPTKTRLFTALPELEFPVTFNWQKAFKLTVTIKSPARRSLVERGLIKLCAKEAVKAQRTKLRKK
jgi:predicted transcriptional regulator of viral defense system